jgi:iron complex transport system permease protein
MTRVVARSWWIASAGFMLLLGLCLFSLSFGVSNYGLGDMLSLLFSQNFHSPDPLLATTFFELRLPRTLAALLVGGGLALSATLLQNITRNPLAEPGLLGVNAGGVLGLVIGLTYWGAESVESYLLWAGGGALLANVVVLAIGGLSRRTSPPRLILIGVAVSATLGGLANFILMSHDTALDQFRFWNLGSLSGVKLSSVAGVAPFVIASWLVVILIKRSLAAMQLGDDQAKAMGVPTEFVRIAVWLLTATMTAGAIALAGPIIFAGFLAASLARTLAPTYFGRQALYSWLAGMILALISDNFARWIVKPFEVPISVVIALIGAPFMIAVTRSRTFRSALIGDYQL